MIRCKYSNYFDKWQTSRRSEQLLPADGRDEILQVEGLEISDVAEAARREFLQRGPQQLSARLVANPALTLVVRADEEAKHGDVMAVKLLARKLGVPKILEATSGREASR